MAPVHKVVPIPTPSVVVAPRAERVSASTLLLDRAADWVFVGTQVMYLVELVQYDWSIVERSTWRNMLE